MGSNLFEIFRIFLRLGLTSFGGPIAHLGFFRNEFVTRRKWIDEHAYSDLIALCQFLPGPASSQVGIALGLSRGGIFGSVAAWLGFTLPSAIILVFFGLGISSYASVLGSGWLHGLKIVAVAVVAQALWGMAVKLCPDRTRATIAIGSCIVSASLPFAFGQIGVIVIGALLGWKFLSQSVELPHSPINTRLSQKWAIFFVIIFFTLLLILPIAARSLDSQSLKMFDSFFRAGSLVFGGGHVVLPLLQSEVVSPGWVSKDTFMAGYGAAQAIPGPLFTFSAFLGAVNKVGPSRWIGATITLLAAFLPSFLLVWGVFPFWERLRASLRVRNAMLGINASVVGLLLAAFYNPVWTSAIQSTRDFSLALVAFLLLVFWNFAPWLVVLISAFMGWAIL